MTDVTLDVVIAGAGRVGSRAAQLVDDYGHSVTVVERDESRCDALSQEYVATVINGDASRPEIIRQADLEAADVVAALTGNPGVNLAICVLAARLGGDLRTVMRVDHPGGESYREVVDDVVYPEGLGALGAANAIVGTEVRALEDVSGDLSILEITVTEEAPVAGRSLTEISLPRGSLVVSDAAGNNLATGETELRPGQTYLVATQPEVAEEITQLFRG